MLVLISLLVSIFLVTGNTHRSVSNAMPLLSGKTGKQGLKRRISTFDVASASGQTIKFIAQKLKEVNIDDVAKQSKGVATLYAWLSGMISERNLES